MEESNIEELAFLEMKELEEILKNFLYQYFSKPFELDSRVKSLSKIKQKQNLYISRGKNCTLLDVPDIIGFRISVDTEEDVKILMDLINKYLAPTRVVDFFNTPKDTGYKAFNCFFENLEINTEIQIMTKMMRDWTNSTHDEHNKKKYNLSL